MSSTVVLPLVLVIALLAMLAIVFVAMWRARHARSLARAEREGHRAAEGLRHARERADEGWVRNSRPAESSEVRSVVGHTIADRGRTEQG